MKVFDICRGSFKAFSLSGKIEPSILIFETLRTFGDGYLVSGFAFKDAEKVGIIQCFNDYNHVYAFGHDPENSSFAVTYTVFLGQACMRNSFYDGRGRCYVIKEYLRDRVSKKGDTIRITLGHTGFIGIVRGCDINSADAEINTATVTITGYITETFTC